MIPFALEVTATPMENLTSVLTSIWGWITTALTTVTSSPILLIGLGIFVAGAVIGLVYRLIHG